MESSITKRRRAYRPQTAGGQVFIVNDPEHPQGVSNPGVFDFTGTQYTESEGHPWPPSNDGELSDIGGRFYTTKSYAKGRVSSSHTVLRTRKGNQFKYTGPFVTAYPLASGKLAFPPSPESSDSELEQLGTTAIARCEPTNSVADAATFLGELMKDGMPSTPLLHSLQTRADAAVKAGGEFLNVVFGWLPLVSDITKARDAVVHADAVLTQYERDNGKVVRRRYNYPLAKTEEEEILYTSLATLLYAGGGTNVLDNFNPDPSNVGVLYRHRVTTKRRWFSGAFTYHIPVDSDSRLGMARNAADAQKLFGQPLTPETVWELTPWSWAIDWVTNAGDVVHNLSAVAQNGLVMRYGYMMEHSVRQDTYYLVGKSGIVGYPDLQAPPLVLVTETKKRIPANPFGFGVSWSGLSSLQYSILAALGISRRG